MKLLFEAGPLAAFLAVYAWRGIYDATAVLVVLSLLALLAGRWHSGRFSGLTLFTVAVSVVLGGLTVAYRDASFIMIKPTVVFAVFALAILGSHFVGERVVYQRLFGGVLRLRPTIWRRINALWGAYFAIHAVLNLYVAANYSEQTWVLFKVFGFAGMTIAFAALQLPFVWHGLRRGRAPGDTVEAAAELQP